MSRITAAESFLSLFTTRDRAAAITGDLVEQRRASLGNFLAIAFSLVVRSVAAQRIRLLLLAPLGMVLWIIAGNIATIPFRLGFLPPYEWVYGIAVYSIAIPAFVGYVITRLTREREMTGCIAFVVLLAVLTFGKAVIEGYAWSAQFLGSIAGVSFGIPAFFLLTASALTRRHALSRQVRRSC
jgi:hypothetical protein